MKELRRYVPFLATLVLTKKNYCYYYYTLHGLFSMTS